MRTKTLIDFHGDTYYGQESNCVSIAFYRPTNSRAGLPSSDVLVNGVPIEAGATFRIGQNVGDTDTTPYDITFIPGVGTENEVYVIRVVSAENGRL